MERCSGQYVLLYSSQQCQRNRRRRAATAAAAAAVTRAARVNIIIIPTLRHVMTVTKPRLIMIIPAPAAAELCTLFDILLRQTVTAIQLSA